MASQAAKGIDPAQTIAQKDYGSEQNFPPNVALY